MGRRKTVQDAEMVSMWLQGKWVRQIEKAASIRKIPKSEAFRTIIKNGLRTYLIQSLEGFQSHLEQRLADMEAEIRTDSELEAIYQKNKGKSEMEFTGLGLDKARLLMDAVVTHNTLENLDLLIRHPNGILGVEEIRKPLSEEDKKRLKECIRGVDRILSDRGSGKD